MSPKHTQDLTDPGMSWYFENKSTSSFKYALYLGWMLLYFWKWPTLHHALTLLRTSLRLGRWPYQTEWQSHFNSNLRGNWCFNQNEMLQHVPDYSHNITQAKKALDTRISATDALSANSVLAWSQQLPSLWKAFSLPGIILLIFLWCCWVYGCTLCVGTQDKLTRYFNLDTY